VWDAAGAVEEMKVDVPHNDFRFHEPEFIRK